MSNATLDGIDILQTSTTGFGYPDNVVMTPILDDGSYVGGNAVLQTAALTLKQCSIEFYTDVDADRDALQAAKQAADGAIYVDEQGNSHDVTILSLTTTRAGTALWQCQCTMVESPPSGSGS